MVGVAACCAERRVEERSSREQKIKALVALEVQEIRALVAGVGKELVLFTEEFRVVSLVG